MTIRRMHVDEVIKDVSIVQDLVAAQFPQWAELSITPVPSSGTDNAMFRLGEDMVVRMPRRPGGGDIVVREQRWLPMLAPHVPVDVPTMLSQ